MLSRGSTEANVIIGLGAGKDYADVRVDLCNKSGQSLMSFVVHGSVIDKRYRQLDEVLYNYVADRIVREIKSASS